MTEFAQETLELAQSLTAHHVEINELRTDADGCCLHIGHSSAVEVNEATGEALLEVDINTFEFGNVTAAIQAADTYETVMLAIAEAAKASREPEPSRIDADGCTIPGHWPAEKWANMPLAYRKNYHEVNRLRGELNPTTEEVR